MLPLTRTPLTRESRRRVYACCMAILIACWIPVEIIGQVALRGAPTTATAKGSTLTIGAPVGVAPGDILIANVATTGAASAASLAGWTVIRSASLTTSPRRYATVLYRVAGSTEPATYGFSAGSGAIAASGGILAFSGVDNTNPFDVATPTIRQATSTTVTATGVTTARTNTAIVFFGQAVGTAGGSSVRWNTSTWKTSSSPGALIELYDIEETTNRVSVGADHQPGVRGRRLGYPPGNRSYGKWNGYHHYRCAQRRRFGCPAGKGCGPASDFRPVASFQCYGSSRNISDHRGFQ